MGSYVMVHMHDAGVPKVSSVSTSPLRLDVHRFYVIRPKTNGTLWTFPLARFNYFLHTGIAEQVVAFCNDNLAFNKKEESEDYTRDTIMIMMIILF